MVLLIERLSFSEFYTVGNCFNTFTKSVNIATGICSINCTEGRAGLSHLFVDLLQTKK